VSDLFPIDRLVSGGQAGVDRGALDAAIACELPHGGWCPRGRRAEDGVIPPRYELEEHASRNYPGRTLQNVLDSDATLLLNRGSLSGGTALTQRLAKEHGKPWLLVALDQDPDPGSVLTWLDEHAVNILNVAGPRESGSPGIAELAREFIISMLRASPPA